MCEPVEPRLLCARDTSAQPQSLGKAFDITERAVLLQRMPNLPSDVYAALSKRVKLNKVGAFDEILLTYSRQRRSGQFFFDDSHAAPITAYVNEHADSFDEETVLERARMIANHRFPSQSSVSEYDVVLPSNINWNNPDPKGELGVEFLHAMQRHDWFDELAQAYRYTGNAAFGEELIHELADWAGENPTGQAPENWSTRDQKAWWFDTAIRTEQWMWAYFTMLDSPVWTPAANSLMLYKLQQHGDVMEAILPDVVDYRSNKTVALGRSLLFLGDVFPEFDFAAMWQTQGRGVLFNAMDAQLYADGSHVEQSPGYAVLILQNLLEARMLDAINGVDWPDRRLKKLARGVNALWQQMSPNFLRPGIGDTYRIASPELFLRASIILEATIWPTPRPQLRDVWLFGPDKITTYLGEPSFPKIGNRGATYTLPDSGNYVMRSGNDRYARQIHFDAGPTGGGHGHFDLLGIELYGYDKPLIADPGAYVYIEGNRHRDWVRSTPAHNTIGIRGLSHAAIDEANWTNKISASDFRQLKGGGYMVSASHLGYGSLPGQPIVGRSVYFDGSETMIVVDYAQSSTAYDYQASFNLPERTNWIGPRGTPAVASNEQSRGNVRIDVVQRKGQQIRLETEGIFASFDPPPNHVTKRTRLSVTQKAAKLVAFAYVIRTSIGDSPKTAPDVSWKHVPTRIDDPAILTVNGKDMMFEIPTRRMIASRAALAK